MSEKFGRFARTLALGGALVTGAGNEGCDTPKENSQVEAQQYLQKDFFMPFDVPINTEDQKSLIKNLHLNRSNSLSLHALISRSNISSIEKMLIIKNNKSLFPQPSKLEEIKLIVFSEATEEEKQIIFRGEATSVETHTLVLEKKYTAQYIKEMFRLMDRDNPSQKNEFLTQELDATEKRIRDLQHGQENQEAELEKQRLEIYRNFLQLELGEEVK